MTSYSYDIKIPQDRVAVLIGKDGSVKKSLEQATDTKINVDSQEGDVSVSGEDTLKLFACREIIKAIGRGFNPDVAISLLKQDFSLELIDMTEYAKTKNDMIRMKGRVIGQEGKARRFIENLTDTRICVYGKTAGIIGEVQHVSLARRAVESLLSGSPHANVYKWLEKQRRGLRQMVEIRKEVE